MKVLLVFGTRPEAIKLAPLAAALRACPQLSLKTCATGQHRRLLDQGLDAFGLVPDVDLDLMRPDQTSGALTARILQALEPVLRADRPDLVVVQGDTTSALAGALAARFHRIAVAHVEAGLRSGDLSSPYPEEGNRRLIDQIAVLHFAPTRTAVRALLAEGHAPEGIHHTGNTGVDAVLQMAERVRNTRLQDYPALRALPRSVTERDAPLMLVTTHRRESFKGGIANICRALIRLTIAHPGLAIVLPVHPNPAVHRVVRPALTEVEGITLLPPLPYPAMVRLLLRTQVLFTDSGGLQEEAPSLGLRCLVGRACTERHEGLEAGAAVLVGTDPRAIFDRASLWLSEPQRSRWQGENPYGDGGAAATIAQILFQRAAKQVG